MQVKILNKKINKLRAFTLIELIVVIAVISILASILLLSLNPTVIFGNARNSQRSSDLNSIQSSILRYLASSPVNGTGYSLTDFPGYTNLYANATIGSPISGNCPNGINGNNLPSSGSFGLDITGGNIIDLTKLINGGYLSKMPKDPFGSPYQACIDTSNSNQLILFSINGENNAIINTQSAGTQTITGLVAADSFNRANNSSSLGNADSGQTWLYGGTGTWGISNNQANVTNYLGGDILAYLNTGQSDGTITVTLNNLSGLYNGIGFRYLDNNNFWGFQNQTSNQYLFYKKQGGAYINIAQFTVTPKSGDVLKIVMKGSNIQVYVNNSIAGSTSDSFNQSSTKHGIIGNNASSVYWDNFFITNP